VAAVPAVASGDIVAKRIHFTVQNVNRSNVPCSSDGATYEIADRLVARGF
jgi:hypothetical protein